jgi:hypothetical protein
MVMIIGSIKPLKMGLLGTLIDGGQPIKQTCKQNVRSSEEILFSAKGI